MTQQHTPGPWEINWYECRMDRDDVAYAHKEGNLSAKVGDVLWRSPRSIGPCEIENSHWGGDLLTVEEADARLIAAAPDLLFWMRYIAEQTNVQHIQDTARNAIAQATGETP